MQGFTLKQAIVDLNFDSNTNKSTGYVALSRVKKADDILIMQPFKADIFQQGPMQQPKMLYAHMRGESIQHMIDEFKLQQDNKAKQKEKEKRQRISAVRKEAGRKGGLATGNSAGPAKRQKNQADDSAVIVGVETHLCQPCKTTSTKRHRSGVTRPDVSMHNATLNQDAERQSKKAKKPRKPRICSCCGPKPATKFCPRKIKNSDISADTPCHDCTTYCCTLN